jgi:hypothetical protein
MKSRKEDTPSSGPNQPAVTGRGRRLFVEPSLNHRHALDELRDDARRLILEEQIVALLAFQEARAHEHRAAVPASDHADYKTPAFAGLSPDALAESYRGRKPSYTREQLAMVQDMLGQSANIVAIASCRRSAASCLWSVDQRNEPRSL